MRVNERFRRQVISLNPRPVYPANFILCGGKHFLSFPWEAAGQSRTNPAALSHCLGNFLNLNSIAKAFVFFGDEGGHNFAVRPGNAFDSGSVFFVYGCNRNFKSCI